MNYPPLIVIGMHRSGTSMITGLLEDLGLFMGRKQNQNEEAWFFLRVNQWLLRQSGGDWDNPASFARIIDDPQVRPLMVDFMRFTLSTPRAVNFLGWSTYLRCRSILNLDGAWGWKDPQNTFTLPLWLDIFPQARVLHIYRNGVDVASSLKTRSDRRLWSLEKWKRPHLRPLYSLSMRLFPNFHVRHFSLASGFALWELYTAQADAHIAALPAARAICYEAFLSNPLPMLEDLCAFAGVTLSSERIRQAAAKIKPERSAAFRQDTELMRFYESVKDSPQMVKYGY